MDRIQQTLAELGGGFAFVGRQVRFEVDGDDFAIDLLFFHVEQLRYVVVELKIGKFEPGFAPAQLLRQLGGRPAPAAPARTDRRPAPLRGTQW